LPLEQWASATAELLAAAGFDDIVQRTTPFRSGEGLVLQAEKRRPCNQKAP
jgi:hypothetical protein